MDPTPRKQLFKAIESADLDAVEGLLATHIDPDSRNANGQPALVVAAGKGHLEIVHALLKAGANVNLHSVSSQCDRSTGPTVWMSPMPGPTSFAQAIDEATENADPETQAFFAGVKQFFSAFSNSDSLSSESSDRGTDSSDISESELNEHIETTEDYEDRETPLKAAIAGSHLSVVKALIAAGAEINGTVWWDTPPLQIAVQIGNLNIVQMLIDAGSSVNYGFESTPLEEAVRQQNLDLVRLLIQAGANVNQADSDGCTVLMTAAGQSSLEIVKFLVENGADVNACEQWNAPLVCAAHGGQREVYDFLYPLASEKIRKLGEKKIDKGVKAKERREKHHIEDFIEGAMFGNLAAVEAAIQTGIDVNAIGSNGETALMYAANYGHVPVIRALLDAGADPDILSEEGGLGEEKTALMHVAESFFAGNRQEVIHILAQAGANLNAKGQNGKTALMCAVTARSGYSAAVNALIEAGANLDETDDDGNTAMMLAEAASHSKMVEMLKQAGASEAGMNDIALIQAAARGDVERVKALIQMGVNVDRRAYTTALCNATYEGHHEIVTLLIAAGADVNRGDTEGSCNPLLNAAYRGDLEIVRTLIEAGADVNVSVEGVDNSLEYTELGMLEGHHKDGQHAEVMELLQQLGVRKS